jgi:chromosome partitioning protein
MSKQIRIALLSNAGGSGKTTLATHLAYLLGRSGYKVALIDLDPQGSVSLFCGLPRPNVEHTIAAVLQETFTGQWPLVPIWEQSMNLVDACQGEMGLVKTTSELVLHERGAYLLSDRLLDHPLPHDVVIFDCPATLGPLPLIALSACTHLLVPMQVEPKSADGAGKLLEWFYGNFRRLRLRPEPKILGFVPNQYDQRLAIHRNILEQLAPQLKRLNIECFNPIRFSSEFKNASAKGQPLQMYRPGHPACSDFDPIMKKLRNELKETHG